MISKVWIVNIMLVALASFLVVENAGLWLSDYEFPQPAQEKTGRSEDASLERVIANPIPAASDYEAIATDNLFSPERHEFIPEEPEAAPQEEKQEEEAGVEEPPVKLNRDFVLYGVVILAGYKSALISNPEKKNDGVKFLRIKEGDPVGGFTVKSIEEDRVLLDAGPETHEVYLYDEEKPEREIVKADDSKAPRIIAGSQESAGSDAGKAKAAGTDAASAQGNAGQAEKEVEYINTPFGKIKRIK